MTFEAALSSALRRDRTIAIAALVGLTALSWGYLAWLARQMASMSMSDMPGMDMRHMMMAPAFVPWAPAHFAFMFCMWAVMMVGMMTPSIAPMVLIYQQIARQSGARGQPFASAGWFAAGYLAAWSAFSAAATLTQWALEALSLLTPMMASSSRRLAGVVLIAAGLYQWLPFKEACLAQCRAPLSFIQSRGGFQASARGSLRLGFHHGMFCIGCCWALMALLFVGGVMNLLWIAALMIFVLLEKLIPRHRYVSRGAGLLAIAWGVERAFIGV